MELVKLGKKGQVTIPIGILRALGVREDSPMLVEATGDGGIMLRPAAVYPFEMYSDARVVEFERENAVPAALLAKVDRAIAKKKRG
jgi:AbrB family looped-hinge helix DNA binding protein